jgi:hypothetical protein
MSDMQEYDFMPNNLQNNKNKAGKEERNLPLGLHSSGSTLGPAIYESYLKYLGYYSLLVHTNIGR